MKNKKGNLPSLLFSIAAILYYISAILAFFSKETDSVVMNICLGTTFLSLSTVYAKKISDTETKDGADEETTESDDQ